MNSGIHKRASACPLQNSGRMRQTQWHVKVKLCQGNAYTNVTHTHTLTLTHTLTHTHTCTNTPTHNTKAYQVSLQQGNALYVYNTHTLMYILTGAEVIAARTCVRLWGGAACTPSASTSSASTAHIRDSSESGSSSSSSSCSRCSTERRRLHFESARGGSRLLSIGLACVPVCEGKCAAFLPFLLHTSAYVNICQLTSAYVSIRCE